MQIIKALIIAPLIALLWQPLFAVERYSVGVESIDYMPYYGVKNKQWTGYGRELLDLFGSKEGIQFNYQIRTVKRLFDEYVNQQKFDFKFPDNPYWNAEMKQKVRVRYSNAVALYTDGMVVRESNRELDKNSIQTIGIVAGFSPPLEYFRMEQQNQIQIIRSHSLNQLIQRLLKNKIQGVYLNVEVGKQLTQKIAPGETVYFNNKLPYLLGSYQLSSIRRGSVIKRFNTFMSQNSSQVDQLKSKYGIR